LIASAFGTTSGDVIEATRLHSANLIIERNHMLVAVAVIIAILWALGFFALHVGGGLIHILLVIALIAFIYSMFAGKRTI
jgi:hypothetical protein